MSASLERPAFQPPPLTLTARPASAMGPTGFSDLVAIFLLLGTFGLFMPPESYFSTESDLTTDSSILSSTLLTASIGIFVLVAAAMRQRAAMKVAGEAGLIWVLLALAFASAGWSALPGIVIRRSGTLLISSTFAFYLCARYDMKGLVALVTGRIQIVIVIASFLISIVAPGVSHSTFENYEDAWRGAMIDKNTMGEVAAVGVITAAYSLASQANTRLVAGFTLAGSVLLLFLARSATAIAETAMCIGLAALFGVLRQKGAEWRLTAVLFAAAAGALGAFIVADPNFVFSLLDRSTDVTGRDQLWYEVVLAIERKPWLGYGFGAFWSDQNPLVVAIWQRIGWQPPHAHNGWLDVTLQLGLVGCAVQVLMWLIAFYRAIRLSLSRQVHGAVYCLVMLFCLFVNNLTENTIPRPQHFAWIMFIFCYVNLSRWSTELREARHVGNQLVPGAAQGASA